MRLFLFCLHWLTDLICVHIFDFLFCFSYQVNIVGGIWSFWDWSCLYWFNYSLMEISLSCRFDYPQPTFQKLMKEHCMEPFFVFQVFFSRCFSLISSFLLYIFGSSLFCYYVFCSPCMHRSSVWVSGVWMNIGITVCSPCSCCLCLSQQWQKVG